MDGTSLQVDYRCECGECLRYAGVSFEGIWAFCRCGWFYRRRLLGWAKWLRWKP